MQAYIKPIKQNNDHRRIGRNIRFCSSFNISTKNFNLELNQVSDISSLNLAELVVNELTKSISITNFINIPLKISVKISRAYN